VILTVRSERATERKFQGAKWPGNERAREGVGQGANRPESHWPIRSGERISPGAKRLGTVHTEAGGAGAWFIRTDDRYSCYQSCTSGFDEFSPFKWFL